MTTRARLATTIADAATTVSLLTSLLPMLTSNTSHAPPGVHWWSWVLGALGWALSSWAAKQRPEPGGGAARGQPHGTQTRPSPQ